MHVYRTIATEESDGERRHQTRDAAAAPPQNGGRETEEGIKLAESPAPAFPWIVFVDAAGCVCLGVPLLLFLAAGEKAEAMRKEGDLEGGGGTWVEEEEDGEEAPSWARGVGVEEERNSGPGEEDESFHGLRRSGPPALPVPSSKPMAHSSPLFGPLWLKGTPKEKHRKVLVVGKERKSIPVEPFLRSILCLWLLAWLTGTNTLHARTARWTAMRETARAAPPQARRREMHPPSRSCAGLRVPEFVRPRRAAVDAVSSTVVAARSGPRLPGNRPVFLLSPTPLCPGRLPPRATPHPAMHGRRRTCYRCCYWCSPSRPSSSSRRARSRPSRMPTRLRPSRRRRAAEQDAEGDRAEGRSPSRRAEASHDEHELGLDFPFPSCTVRAVPFLHSVPPETFL